MLVRQTFCKQPMNNDDQKELCDVFELADWLVLP